MPRAPSRAATDLSQGVETSRDRSERGRPSIAAIMELRTHLLSRERRATLAAADPTGLPRDTASPAPKPAG